MPEMSNVKKLSELSLQLSLFAKFIDAFIVDQDKVEQKLNLEKRLRKIERILDEYEQAQSQLQSENQGDEREEFQNLYYISVSKAESMLQQYKLNNTALETPNAGKNDLVSRETSFIKLPILNLCTFGGLYTKWPEFADNFRNLIDNNTSLSDAQKLSYLKSCLKGEPAFLINALKITNTNYRIGWERLEKRFNNKRRIIYDHVQNIIDIPTVSKESYFLLYQLIIIVQNNVDCLKTHNLKVDQWSPMLVPLIISKLDVQTVKEWESNLNSNFDNNYIPEISQLIAFLYSKQNTLEVTKGKYKFDNKTVQGKKDVKVLVSSATPSNLVCLNCNGSHAVQNCESFLNLSVTERCEKIKSHRACINCFKKGHFAPYCKQTKRCAKCKGRHNILLHIDRNNTVLSGQTNSISSDGPSGLNPTAESFHTANFSLCGGFSESLLSTAKVIGVNEQNAIELRAILDSASQSNFITRHMSEKLGLKPIIVETRIRGINGGQAVTNELVTLTIKSRFNNYSVNLQFLVLDEIINNLPSFSIAIDKDQIPSNLRLADPEFNISAPIDILIGVNIFYELLCIGQIKNPNFPIMQKTVFGWIVSGELSRLINPLNSQLANKSVSFLTLSELHQNVEKFWNIDEFRQCKKNLTVEEKYCEQYFTETTTRDNSGKFIVKIPFKNNFTNVLGNSEQLAKNRFLSLEKRFVSDKILKEKYTEFMQEYINLGHMAKVKPSDDGFFLPHFSVINNLSETTKLRVVFDGACQVNSGLPVNMVQHTGPTIQNELFEIIAKFRNTKYAITGDIKKMYRQVWVHESNRKFQKIYWRSDQNDDLNVYELKTVTYGLTSAPYLAIRCLFQLALDNEIAFPLESKIIRESFYVDDVLTGANSIKDLFTIKCNLETILNQGGFQLTKWYSNEPSLSDNFVENIQIGEQVCKKLGVWWNPTSDLLTYNVCLKDTGTVTKRSILAISSQLFDPLGFLAPIIIIAKFILQELWKLEITWDEAIPLEIGFKWIKFKDNLESINKIKIPRYNVVDNPLVIELHAFSDASEKGYGSCLYLKSSNNQEIQIHLLAAKSRVAPTKCVTLPRLELCAAVLAAQLVSKFVKILDLTIHTITFWCDSTIVLGWIKSDANRFQTYVSNRVTEIQTLTDPKCWRHVKSKDNPADLISRGVYPSDLINYDLWWHGPNWLKSDKIENESKSEISLASLPEQRKNVTTFVATICEDIFQCSNFSTLGRLQRVVAYCLRFISNSRKTTKTKLLGPLQVTELSKAMNTLVKQIQQECFPKELSELKGRNTLCSKSILLSLAPFLDTDDLIRVGGRLAQSDFNYDKKYPLILPKGHHFTELILRDTHKKLMHAGPKLLLSTVREKFWPLNGINTAKKVVRSCTTCFRFNAKPSVQKMGALPKERLESQYPFYATGIDYAGPILIKDRYTRNTKMIKAYICIFVCFAVKCVHIELVTSLNTESFLLALKGFIGRRGKPVHLFSDNATNFVGAHNELNELYQFVENNKSHFVTTVANEGIQWHFIPPHSPNFGGLWEAGVKSIKHHLKRTLKNISLTYEQLNTHLVQIESILNSRPLSPLSSDPSDFNVLTPAHFLIKRTFTDIPEENVLNLPQSRLSQYQHLQRLQQHFWERWSKEYISELQQRTKWCKNQVHLRTGDMVLIKEDNQPPAKWQLGRVINLYPGGDGVPRVADIKCQSGVQKRAVSKICVLPIDGIEN